MKNSQHKKPSHIYSTQSIYDNIVDILREAPVYSFVMCSSLTHMVVSNTEALGHLEGMLDSILHVDVHEFLEVLLGGT